MVWCLHTDTKKANGNTKRLNRRKEMHGCITQYVSVLLGHIDNNVKYVYAKRGGNHGLSCARFKSGGVGIARLPPY
jgi:hypothetical protein